MSFAHLADYAFKKFPSAAVIIITDDEGGQSRHDSPVKLAERTEVWSFPSAYLSRLKQIDDAEAAQMHQIAEARRHGVELG